MRVRTAAYRESRCTRGIGSDAGVRGWQRFAGRRLAAAMRRAVWSSSRIGSTSYNAAWRNETGSPPCGTCYLQSLILNPYPDRWSLRIPDRETIRRVTSVWRAS
jgi:hypothetical protein